MDTMATTITGIPITPTELRLALESAMTATRRDRITPEGSFHVWL